uniref:Gamma-aminobutyric acid receptor subunit beta n=1 Tax=Plectus sambesii TaxID=2011161 RepID=A0A914UW18_9BILA
MRRHVRPIVLLLFVTHFSSVADAFDADYQDLSADPKRNTTVISDVLNKLVDPKNYDKRLRPKYGREPVDVGITIHVSSISAVSEVDMDFTLDFYLRQTWRDPRLAYDKFDIGWKTESGKLESLTVGVDYLDKLWKPDTFFPNEKKSFFHVATTHNSFLRIDPDGTVFTSQRLTVTATCPMVLHLFPMDSQKCKLEIESYGYSTDDISYSWFQGLKSISRSPFELPQFRLTDNQISTKLEKLSSGVYSRLICRFLFTRSIGFYIIQIYLPSMLIVIISWVSFWLSRDATPARVALGVTTVLTMTTLMTTTNAAMPKVSYVKSIDIYLGTCFLMVFASLLEYAAVGYINKRMKLRKDRKKMQKDAQLASAQQQHQTTFSPRNSPAATHRMLLPMQEPSTPRMLPSTSPLSGPAQFHEVECDCDLKGHSFGTSRLRRVSLKSPIRAPKRNRCKLSPSSIDKYSRIIFPLTFIAFNGVYWVIYMHVSKTALDIGDAGGSPDEIS